MSQHMEVLAEANRRRLARADLKRQIKSEPSLLLDVLEDPPDFVENAELGEMFRALPRFGPERTGKLVNACEMSVHKRVGTLTARQRKLLIDALSEVLAVAA